MCSQSAQFNPLDQDRLVQHVNESTHKDGHTIDLGIARDRSQLISGNIKVSDPGLCNDNGHLIKECYLLTAPFFV